jgi:translation initiation factor IF-2
VEKNGRKIVFIDTPGHEAFTRMRARGAKVTDIVVLVVAADDGVMPQTLEAIDHARAAGVPIIVAVNKVDKLDAQPERIKQQLADRGLLSEDWGGDTITVPVSAKTHQNLDLLLEMILLQADMLDLKANPGRPGMGSVIEAQLDRGRGPVATVLVRNGTLRVGDSFICGSVLGKVRAMYNDRGLQVRKAEPSTPVEVLGLESLPDAGDDFQVVTDTAKAKQIVAFRDQKTREAALAKSSRLTLEQLHKQMEAGEVKELPLIIKADVAGSAEVLTETLQKLSNDKVKVLVIHSGVGAINESDVLLASTSNAIIIGFNVRPERKAEALAEQEKVDVRLHTIIYNLSDEIKRAMSGLLAPVFKEVYRGKAEVRETFRIPKVGAVAGCQVQDGSIARNSEVRLLRDNVVVYTGKISSLRRFKDDVSEVKSGMECGIALENYADVKQGDIIEAFVTERVATEVFA